MPLLPLTRQPDESNQLLAGQQVAVAGRLASMSRAEAARLIAALGGRFARRVTRHTSLLVIGRRGLPLSGQGGLSLHLTQSEELAREGLTVRTCSEEDFLQQIGLCGSEHDVHRLYTGEELVGLLGISRSLLASWVRAGLVQPVERFHSLHYFDFVQVSAAKKLTELAKAGVGTGRIRRSLEQLAQWLPDMDAPLAQLQILERHGQLVFRTQSGQLAEPAGQMHIDFSNITTPSLRLTLDPQTAEEWFDRGCQHEEAAEWQAAESAYRQALLAGGPDADAVFNLANVLWAMHRPAEAAERFRQAVEIEPTFVDAWNNLGVVLAELKQCDDALWAYRQALELDPNYCDAHYNLAECLHRNGCTSDAEQHWRRYLQHDDRSDWATYARECLDKLRM